MPPFNILESASPELRTWLLMNGEKASFPQTVLIKGGSATVNGAVGGSSECDHLKPAARPGAAVDPDSGMLGWRNELLEKKPAVATITSSGDCTVLRLSIEQLELLDRQQPTLAAQLHRVIAQKLAMQIQERNVWAHRLRINHGPVEALRKILTLFAIQERCFQAGWPWTAASRTTSDVAPESGR